MSLYGHTDMFMPGYASICPSQPLAHIMSIHTYLWQSILLFVSYMPISAIYALLCPNTYVYASECLYKLLYMPISTIDAHICPYRHVMPMQTSLCHCMALYAYICPSKPFMTLYAHTQMSMPVYASTCPYQPLMPIHTLLCHVINY